MKASSMKLFRRVSAAAAALALAGFGAGAWAHDDLGRPTPGAIDFQPGVTSLRDAALHFHNGVLLPVAVAISVFVLILLLYCVVRFNKRVNPVPARWSHNTPVEVVWTVVPVLILMFIAIFSFRLLFTYHDMPKPDVTVKATGYQWYWGYEYPDLKVSEITSVLVPEEKAAPHMFRLQADTPMVVPVNKTVRVLVTGADVIHAFRVPAFGVMADAIPGRVNQVWFKAEKTGMYYGQCSELCGVDHAFMPINVKVVTQPEFDAWVASKGGGAAAATPTTLAAQANAAGASNTPAPAAGPVQPGPNAAGLNAPNKSPAGPAAATPANPAGPAANPSAPAPGQAQPAPAQH
jgi:cytochrome c oxidase subunit 2